MIRDTNIRCDRHDTRPETTPCAACATLEAEYRAIGLTSKPEPSEPPIGVHP